VPVREKKSRLVTTVELVELGANRMEAARSASTERLAAITFRYGLLISFVALCPLRRSNVAAFELGHHLVRVGEEWWIVIPGRGTKNEEPEERPWPDSLVAALEEWLARWRPVLCAVSHRSAQPIGDALWVTCHGSPMTMMSVYLRITGCTKKAFGSRLIHTSSGISP
jgi:integrase/recombinase XerD